MSEVRVKDKPKSIGKLKKEADKWFSLYVRISGKRECYTCGKKAGYKELQCGHFVHRHIRNTRYDLRNARPQCIGCNIFGNGKPHIFAEKLLEELELDGFKQLLKDG